MDDNTVNIEKILKEKLGDVGLDKLKRGIGTDNPAAIIQKMNTKQKSMLDYVLKNPDALRAFLASPQATDLINKLKGE